MRETSQLFFPQARGVRGMKSALLGIRRSMRPVVLVLMLGLATACGSSEPASGPVAIEFDLDTSTRPITGTFDVTEGVDVLGCAEGTFEDNPGFELTRMMTCTDGGTGTVTFMFEPGGYETGPGLQNGPWEIVDANGDFSGLEGGGDWQATGPSETVQGDVEFGS
ncbi:MAG: hypothetical protein R3324_06095 [Halobacteriales archaeon]|nr:hypothetical protein [Halobacteriales archaeon]